MHLYRRDSGIYFVRLYVPLRLKTAVGKTELHRSTGCRDYRLAKIVAAEMVAQWHRNIEALHHMDVHKLQAGSVKLLGDGYITLAEAADECGATSTDLASRLQARQCGLFVRAHQWRCWLTNDIREDFDHWYDVISGELEVVIDGAKLGGLAGQTDYSGIVSLRFPDELAEVLSGSATAAHICQFMFWPSVSRGLVCDLPGRPIMLSDILVRRLDVNALTRQLLDALPVLHRAKETVVPTEPTSCTAHFSDLCQRYFEHNKDLWVKTDHKRRKADHTTMFMQLMGDLCIDAIDRRAMRKFAETLKDIPRERHKFAQSLGLLKPSYPELVKLKIEHNYPGLSEGEQRKILETLGQIFKWAMAEEEMRSNPAEKLGGEATRLSRKKKKKDHEQRDPLSPDDLEKIFNAVWFKTGCGKVTAKGDYYSYRPHYYWLPILALYCGGRLNELSQLYLADIIEVEGIPSLDFNLVGENKIDIDEGDTPDVSDKSLKNISSARKIPIPQILIELGFIDYVLKLRELGHIRLFPELLFDSEKGYGKYAGKWFNDAFLGRQLEIPRDGTKTFHSLRHNFATALGTLTAIPNQKSDLMGHQRKGSTTEVRYDKGHFLDRKKLIDKIAHPHPSIQPFNVEEGIKALNDGLKLKQTRVSMVKKSDKPL